MHDEDLQQQVTRLLSMLRRVYLHTLPTAVTSAC